jgi:hypothetical protein
MSSCLDVRTGRPLFDARRIEDVESVYSSPVAAGGGAAGGRIDLPGRNGPTVVLKDADKLEVLATNTLDDPFDASPAIAGNDLLLRGHKWLYCIGTP